MSVITAENSKTIANFPALTAREQEVFNLLLSGSIPKEIAANLNISYATVLDHQKNLYRKLDVHNINELLTKYNSVKNSAAAVSPDKIPAEMATSQNPLVADFYDNSFYNSETIWQFKITPSIFYSDKIAVGDKYTLLYSNKITAGEKYVFSFSFKSNIAFNFLDITLIDHSPEANFFTVLTPPSRQCTRSKENTEYSGSVTFTAVKSATSAVPHANVLLLEINADKSTQPTLTFTQFVLKKCD